MASSLGSLNVSLGLDAAEFVAGLSKSAYQLNQFGKQADAAFSSLKNLLAVGLAVVGIDKVTESFLAATEAVAKFQDMADKTGGGAAGFAAMQTAAAATQTPLDAITGAATKLNKSLLTLGAQDSTAAAALKNLGINAKNFIALAPDQRMQALADTTAKYATNANYAANISALLGKNGAELIPFLKAQADAQASLFTDQQIEQADAFMRQLRGTESQAAQLGEAFSLQLMPAIDTLIGGFNDFMKQLLGVDDVSGKLRDDHALANFALDVAEAITPLLAGVADLATMMSRAAYATAAWREEMSGAAHLDFSKMAEGLRNLWSTQGLGAMFAANGPSLGDTIQARINNTRAHLNVGATADPADFAEIDRINGNTKPSTGTKGLDSGSASNARAIALAQLNADIAAIINANKLLQDSYANTDQTISNLHAAGLTSDDDYYSARLTMIETEKNANVSALDAEIARYQSQSATGKDAIALSKQIGDAQTARAKVISDAAQKEKGIYIDQIGYIQKLAEALRSVTIAQQDALDVQNKSQNRDIAGIGQGDKQRSYQGTLDSLNDSYDKQLKSIQDQLDDPNQHLSKDKIDNLHQTQDVIASSQVQAIASYKAYYAQLTTLQGDWTNGALDSLHNYADGAADVADQTKAAFDDAFKGMEDALVSFITTGKLSFTSLADSIVADITRIVIKQQLAAAFGGSGSGGWLASLIGGASGADVNNPSAYVGGSGSSGGILSTLGSWLGGLFGGGKALGGPVQAGSFYQVNERGPELLQTNGKTLLMMGNSGGRVVPMSQSSPGGSVNQTIIFNHTGTVDSKTKTQLAAAALQGLRSGQRNL